MSKILFIIEEICKIIAVIAFLWLLFVIHSFFDGKSSNDEPNKANDVSETIAISEKDIVYTSVIDMLNEYEQNEIAADLKYDGKVVIVTGTVYEVGKTADFITEGTPYILFSSSGASNNFGTVQANFKNKNEIIKLANIEKGQQISVKGTCNGESTFNIMLSDCYIVEL